VAVELGEEQRGGVAEGLLGDEGAGEVAFEAVPDGVGLGDELGGDAVAEEGVDRQLLGHEDVFVVRRERAPHRVEPVVLRAEPGDVPRLPRARRPPVVELQHQELQLLLQRLHPRVLHRAADVAAVGGDPFEGVGRLARARRPRDVHLDRQRPLGELAEERHPLGGADVLAGQRDGDRAGRAVEVRGREQPCDGGDEVVLEVAAQRAGAVAGRVPVAGQRARGRRPTPGA
jgi:hypothetical protein